jgi:hypothetical protein
MDDPHTAPNIAHVPIVALARLAAAPRRASCRDAS